MIINSATRHFAVTKSDSTVIKFKRLYVGGTGDVAVRMGDSLDSVVVYKTVPAGFYLDVTGTGVMSTNTTATNIVGMDF
jgi:hypothetical protein